MILTFLGISTSVLSALFPLGLSASSRAITASLTDPEAVVHAFVEASNARSVDRQLAPTADVLSVRMCSPDGNPSIDNQLNRGEQRFRFQETKTNGGDQESQSSGRLGGSMRPLEMRSVEHSLCGL